MAPSKTTKKAERQTILIRRSNKCIPRRLRGEDQIAREILLNKLIRRNEISALEYSENLSFKKTQKTHLQTVVSEKLARVQSQNKYFQKVHSVFFKTAFFFTRSTHLGTRHGLRTLQLLVPLPADREAQRVKKHIKTYTLMW